MKTILVIDDTLAMRENIVEILQLAPYRVMQAANGKQGVELARQDRPDLILCDIMMPDLDGFGVLHILGNDPNLADVPFIFLTARVDTADFRAGMNLGADDYLTKPFDDLTLLNTVALRLRKRQHGPASINPVGLDKLMRAILDEPDARLLLYDQYPTSSLTANTGSTVPVAGQRPSTALTRARSSYSKPMLLAMNTLRPAWTGRFCSYLALLEETVYTETAELLDDAQLCLIPKTDFLTLINHNQRVANQFIRMLARDVANQQERMLKLAYQSVRKRVAEALLMFHHKFYLKADEPGDEKYLSRHDTLPRKLGAPGWCLYRNGNPHSERLAG